MVQEPAAETRPGFSQHGVYDMFVIFATKPLNDGTKGFRFNILGKKGILRIRKKSHGWNKRYGKSCFIRNMGKVYLATEKPWNHKKFHHFAG